MLRRLLKSKQQPTERSIVYEGHRLTRATVEAIEYQESNQHLNRITASLKDLPIHLHRLYCTFLNFEDIINYSKTAKNERQVGARALVTRYFSDDAAESGTQGISKLPDFTDNASKLNALYYKNFCYFSGGKEFWLIPRIRKLFHYVQDGRLSDIKKLNAYQMRVDIFTHPEGAHSVAQHAAKKRQQAILDYWYSTVLAYYKGHDRDIGTYACPALGDSTLLYWAGCFNQLSVVETLLSAGADINAQSLDRRTVLWIAAYMGHFDIVKLLLDKGARANIANKSGDTPLCIAAKSGHLDIACLLITKEAPKDKLDASFKAGLQFAIQSGYIDRIPVAEPALLDKRIESKKIFLSDELGTLLAVSKKAETSLVFNFCIFGAPRNNLESLQLAIQTDDIGQINKIAERLSSTDDYAKICQEARELTVLLACVTLPRPHPNPVHHESVNAYSH